MKPLEALSQYHKTVAVEMAASCICNMMANYVAQIDGSASSTAKPWAEMSDEEQSRWRSIVTACLNNPAKTPIEQHDRWVLSKQADGWSYGEVADAERKVHPNMVSWEELSVEEQFKDVIFCTAICNSAEYLKNNT